MSARRLRVAVLQRRFGPRFGGAERYAVEMVRELATIHDMHVYAQEFEHDVPGIQAHAVPRFMTRPRWLNQLWFALWTWWHTRDGFDLVHSHENTWHGDVQSVHVRPFRVGLLRGRTGWARWRKRLAMALSPRLLTYWTLESLRMRYGPRRCVVTTSRAVHDEVLAEWPQWQDASQVVTPGVRMPQVEPRDDPSALRTRLGLPVQAHHVPLALFVGNDPIRKGLPSLLRALNLVDDVHLLVVTAPAQVAAARAMASQTGLVARTHVVGSLRDISQAYGAADFLVHPTTEDTYAMVVLEAMAWSLPVIVSDARHCGIAAELREGVNALLLADPHDSTALAQRITGLLSDSALQQRLRNAGPAFAQTRSWPVQAQALQRIYASLS